MVVRPLHLCTSYEENGDIEHQKSRLPSYKRTGLSYALSRKRFLCLLPLHVVDDGEQELDTSCELRGAPVQHGVDNTS